MINGKFFTGVVSLDERWVSQQFFSKHYFFHGKLIILSCCYEENLDVLKQYLEITSLMSFVVQMHHIPASFSHLASWLDSIFDSKP